MNNIDNDNRTSNTARTSDIGALIDMQTAVEKQMFDQYNRVAQENGYCLVSARIKDSSLQFLLIDTKILRRSKDSAFEKFKQLLPKEYQAYDFNNKSPKTFPVEATRIPYSKMLKSIFIDTSYC